MTCRCVPWCVPCCPDRPCSLIYRLAAKHSSEKVYKFSRDNYREMGMMCMIITQYMGSDDKPVVDM
jgi:hypothetical protein